MARRRRRCGPVQDCFIENKGDENPFIDGLYLLFRGYGDAATNDGHGCPIKIENDSGRIRIVVV